MPKKIYYLVGGHQLAGLHYAATQADPSAIFRIVKVWLYIILSAVAVSYCLQAEGPNIQLNQLDDNNLTPLMYAVLADSRQALEILVNSGCRKEQVNMIARGCMGPEIVALNATKFRLTQKAVQQPIMQHTLDDTRP